MVLFGHNDRAFVKHSAIRGDLTGQPCEIVPSGLDLEGPKRLLYKD